MSARTRVLVLGGSGFFGSVIARRLAADERFEVLVGGRSLHKSREACRTMQAAAVPFDVAQPDLRPAMRALGPQVVVHAAGPFMPGHYEVARAAIAARAHYIDLADSRRFVCDITSLDTHAREHGVVALSGASSVPALSSAVVDRYIGDFARLTHVDAGISSSSRMPGVGTLRSVLAYAGRPIARLEERGPREVTGWAGLRRRRFVHAPFARWYCDCDVPDLELFPRRYPQLQSVRFSAGTAWAPLQWALRGFAMLASAGLVRHPASWAPLLHRAGSALQGLGDGRSAMYVTLRGFDRGGARVARHWELHASAHRGAEVPCLAAVALARKLLLGTMPPGAAPCMGMLSLDEYLAETDPRFIRVAID